MQDMNTVFLFDCLSAASSDPDSYGCLAEITSNETSCSLLCWHRRQFTFPHTVVICLCKTDMA